MMHIIQVLACSFALTIVFDSFFEWTLHRFLMHKRVRILPYPFEAHAVTHHGIFKADHTYHLRKERDKEKIPMKGWNGPVLIFLTIQPFLAASIISGNWWIVLASVIASTAYYIAYERLHWCMHLPNHRELESSWIFFRLNGHHLLHHRYMHKNYNVVFPLADLVLGTLLLRSKTRFAQARGPSVPDVQPKRAVQRPRLLDLVPRPLFTS